MVVFQHRDRGTHPALDSRAMAGAALPDALGGWDADVMQRVLRFLPSHISHGLLRRLDRAYRDCWCEQSVPSVFATIASWFLSLRIAYIFVIPCHRV
jgi:hypothetical protein